MSGITRADLRYVRACRRRRPRKRCLDALAWAARCLTLTTRRARWRLRDVRRRAWVAEPAASCIRRRTPGALLCCACQVKFTSLKSMFASLTADRSALVSCDKPSCCRCCQLAS